MTTQILNNIVLIMLGVKLYTASKKLRREDLAINGIDVSKLPPNTLAHLGTKKVIAPSALAPFSALKKEAERLILTKGVRFLGGYAVPTDEAQGLADMLNDIKRRFDANKQELMAKYSTEVEAWIGQNPPEWEPIIRCAVDPISYVDRALQFSFAPIAASTPVGMEESNTGLDEEADGLYGQLCHEIRVTARQAYDGNLVDRKQIYQTTLRPIHAIRAKLAGMVFLEPDLIGKTIEDIDKTLNRLPKSGPIEGVDLNMVAGLLGRELANLGRALPPEPMVEEEPEPEAVVEDVVVTQETLQEAELTPLTWDF